MENRYFKVRVGTEYSNRMKQEEGVPQGSVLSVTCFALAINTIPGCACEGVNTSLYVDDFVIFTTSNHLPSAERRIQRTINNIERWTDYNGFTFSLDKTVVMKFHATNKFQREPDIYVEGNRLKVVKETKFLGLVWDSKLTWVPHIKSLKEKCIKRLNLIKCLSNKDWGADREILLRLYRATIRAKLDYGCQAYGSAKPSVLKMLDSVHHAGIRLSLGAFRSSPVQSMYVESGEPSLEYRRDLLGLQLFTRLLRLPNSPCCMIIHQDDMVEAFNNRERVLKPFGIRMRQLLENLNIEIPNVMPANENKGPPWLINLENAPCTYMTDVNKAIVSTNVTKYLFQEHITEHSDSMHIYTDGSKSNTGVGCAAVFPSTIKMETLPKVATVFSAEIRAIIITLIEIQRIRNRKYTIFSDSLSSLQAIVNYNHQSPMIVKVQNLINECTHMHKQITFCWIPSHVGIEGNERADAAAKEAAEDAVQQVGPLPHTDYYPIYKTALKQRWQREWQNQTQNKLHSIKPNVKQWTTSTQNNRRKSIILTRLRIGHTKLTHEFLCQVHIKHIVRIV